MISIDDIAAMADTKDQKDYWNLSDSDQKESTVKLIEQEHDGMDIIY